MPPIKEIHYFDRSPDYSSPNFLSETKLSSRLIKTDWTKKATIQITDLIKAKKYRTAKWYFNWYFSNYTNRWYLSLFDFSGNKLTGDISPSYSILNEDDVFKMSQVIGDAKIIIMLRSPIDRAWSMLRFQSKLGVDVDWDNAELFIQQIDSPPQEQRSDYARMLKIYSMFFPKKNIIVGFYDAIIDQPDELLSSLLEHIGAEKLAGDPQVLLQKANVSPTIDMPERVRLHLTNKYRASIEALSDQFGGYTTLWLNKIDNPNTRMPKKPHPPVSFLH